MQFGSLVASTAPGDATKDGGHADSAEDEKPLGSIGENVRRAAQLPDTAAKGFGASRQGISRHGREYTVRAAFSREGEIMAPPRVTYSSHDALVEVRDVDRDAAFTLRLADRQLGKPTLNCSRWLLITFKAKNLLQKGH